MAKEITAFPELTTAERNALTSVPTGTIINNTDTNQFEKWDGATWVSQGITSINAPSKRYIDFLSGNDANDGSLDSPWKTLNHAYTTVVDASINKPYVFYLSGGNNDTDTAITAKPNISLFCEYQIQITPSFTISGGVTNDTCTFTNITFVGAFSWVRNDATAIGCSFNNCAFFSGPTVQQTGAGSLLLQSLNSTFVNSTFQASAGAVFSDCNFLGSTSFPDPNSAASFIQFNGGYSGGAMTFSGLINPVYFSGFIHDVAFGASLTFVTTVNGTPAVELDDSGFPPTFTGTPTVTYLSQAPYVKYSPATPGNWSSVPAQVAAALDTLAASGGSLAIATIKDVKPNNTPGGTFTSGVWQTRDLNTLADPHGIVTSLIANQFVLPAGTYFIRTLAPALEVARHKIKLRNITDSTDTIIGESSFADTAAGVQSNSYLEGQFTIPSSKTFEIQHQGSTTEPTDGFGLASNFGVDEVYTQVEISKVIPPPPNVGKSAFIYDQKPNNTPGGNFVSGAWQTRDLNTLVDTSSIVTSLVANQFILPAGTYNLFAEAPGFQVDRHKAKLRDITNSQDILIGSNVYNLSTSSYAMGLSIIDGEFTILAPTTFEIQHQCETTHNSSGFGVESNFGVVEVYTQVKITRKA